MDLSYIDLALRRIRNEKDNNRPWQYNEALDWVLDYIGANWDEMDEMLDEERELKELLNEETR